MHTETKEHLARQLVDLFYPLVELTLLDKNGCVKEIFNPFSLNGFVANLPNPSILLNISKLTSFFNKFSISSYLG